MSGIKRLKKNDPHPDKNMPASGDDRHDQRHNQTSVYESDCKGQTKDRANHDNEYREGHGNGEAGTSCRKEENPIQVSLPEQGPNIITEKEAEQDLPRSVAVIHVSFTSSLSISIFCATIIVSLAPVGAQVLFFSLYSWGLISVLLIRGAAPIGPSGFWQRVFRYLLVVSREMTGLRLCLATLSAAFYGMADNEAMVITSGLCAVASSAVCLFQDMVVLGTRRAII